jgi:hypothetical protein
MKRKAFEEIPGPSTKKGRRYPEPIHERRLFVKATVMWTVTGRMGTGRAVRNREYQLDETRLGKEQIVNLSITYCKTIVN